MNLRNQTVPFRGTSGFSLVEVTIAMAIAAVSMVTIMGMLPQGIKTMRDAGDEAIIGRIHQQVLNELQVADFDALDTYDEMEIYYDSQGEELSDSKNQGSAEASRKAGGFHHVYTAKIAVPSAGRNMPTSVGGAAAVGVSFDNKQTVNSVIRAVVIEVAIVGGMGSDFDWSSEDNRRSIKTYQTNVVKMGQAF